MRKIILLLLFFIPFYSFSQPFTLDPGIKPVKLKLHKYTPSKQPNAKGRISVTDVTQVKDTLYFFADGASIYSPVYVGVTAKDKNVPLDVQLHKMNWKKADRTGTTGNKGHWEEKFKTENDFGIMVIAKNKPATYAMVVWVGDEAKIDMPSVFKKGGVASGSGGFFKKNLLYIIIGVLVLIVGVMFFKLKNRKNEKIN